MEFTPVEDTIKHIREGGIAVIVDDEDRENEGDFICAGEAVTPEIVNFMVTRGRGLFCAALLAERARDLRLEPSVSSNTALMRTAFTVTVDLRTLKTGISAGERARTVKALSDPRTRPDDLARPGHVQPIVAHEGGVLRRAGHTEAAVDLARMAGLSPVGVLIEILDDDGEMARRPRLLEISREHRMPYTSISELIRYRRRHEKLVHRVATAELPTRWGMFRLISYEVDHETQHPFALVLGDLERAESPLVRMHSACFTGDVLDSLRCDCGDQLRLSMERISIEGAGAVVYLPQEGRGIGLAEKIKAYALQDHGVDTVEANILLGYQADMRDYGVGIQILKDLGLSRIRILTNNPKKMESFIYYGYDLEVVDQVELWAEPNPYSETYLKTKRDKMGHHLPPDPIVPGKAADSVSPGCAPSPSGAEESCQPSPSSNADRTP
jgi:3,4-dihydroxy 2-butanone 4-phosphate synthase/GTP cyclohydrolase II